ncbi:MAG: DUF4381 domain-containing protein [Pseudomonadota bacterium]
MTPDQLSALANTPSPNISLPHSPNPGMPASVPNIDNQLKALADIHLPDQISWWPPAPGWWLVLVGTVVLAYLAYKFIKKKLHQAKYKKQAREELLTLSRFWKKQQNLIATASRLSVLMRRIALANNLSTTRTEIASLSDQQWLLYLEQQPGLTGSSKLYSEILIELAYQDPIIHFDMSQQQQLTKKMDSLLSSVSIWINKGFKHV